MSADLLFSRQPGNANNDVVAIALLLASVAILVNARSAERPRAAARRAGLAAGLALGTKLTIVPPGRRADDRRHRHRGLGRARSGPRAPGSPACFAGGGLWYVRDLIVVGDPVPVRRHRPAVEARGARGPRALLGRPLPDRHRRLGPLLQAGPGGAARRPLAAHPARGRRRRRRSGLWRGRAPRADARRRGRRLGRRLPADAARGLGARRACRSASGSTSATWRPALALGLVLAAIPPPLLKDEWRSAGGAPAQSGCSRS